MNSRDLRRRTRISIRSILQRNSTTEPFLSGDYFARLADIYIGSAIQLEYLDDLVGVRKEPATFFVESHLLEEALENSFFRTKCKALICGNSDFNFLEPLNLPHSTRLALLQNSMISDNDRIFTLPIGIENARLGRYNVRKYMQTYEGSRIENKVLLPPMSPTNPIRFEIRERLTPRTDLFDVHSEYLDERAYLELSNGYRFILSLPGNGIEDHRIWETLYRGGYPVVLENSWSESLKILDLPILFIKEIEDLNRTLLSQHRQAWDAHSPLDYPSLWMPYWRKLWTMAIAD